VTDLRNVPPVGTPKPPVSGGFGESVETAGIEPAQGSPRPMLASGRGGAFHCAYCQRYQRNGGEYDHSPIPARHGGEEVLRVCYRCHDLKDRLPLDGWTWDEVSSATRAIAELPEDKDKYLATMEAFSAAFKTRDPWRLPDPEDMLALAMAAGSAEACIFILKGYAAVLDCCAERTAA
jgi:hypothetical protein